MVRTTNTTACPEKDTCTRQKNGSVVHSDRGTLTGNVAEHYEHGKTGQTLVTLAADATEGYNVSKALVCQVL